MYIDESLILETDNLSLKMVSEEDIPFVYDASRKEGFNDGMLWEAPKEEKELLEPLKNNIKVWRNQTGFSFTIFDTKTKHRLGRISIRKTNAPFTWNVGFWTHPKVQSKGIMTEALGKILSFAFNQLGAQNVEACYATWNKASEKVLKRNGFIFIKDIEQGFKKKGEWVAEKLLGIAKSDWVNKSL